MERAQARRARRLVASFDRQADGAPPVYLAHDDVAAAARIVTLAQSSGGAFVRRWEAMGGRSVAPDQADEIAAIYRGYYISALMRSGVCPSSRAALYIARNNPLPFRALRAWIGAQRAAASQVRSYLYGHGAERCEFASIHEPARQSSLESLAALWTHGPDADTTERVDVPDYIAAIGDACRTSPRLRGHVRQHVRHYADCLRVYWIMSGSRKTAAGMRADLRMLATAARIARSGGLERLDGKYLGDGNAAPALLRVSLCNLRQHIAAGDVLQTEQPEAAELILSLQRKGKHRKYTAPAWMHAAAAEALADVTPAATADAAAQTVDLHIPAPARIGRNDSGHGLYLCYGRVCAYGMTHASERPTLTAYAQSLLARA